MKKLPWIRRSAGRLKHIDGQAVYASRADAGLEEEPWLDTRERLILIRGWRDECARLSELHDAAVRKAKAKNAMSVLPVLFISAVNFFPRHSRNRGRFTLDDQVCHPSYTAAVCSPFTCACVSQPTHLLAHEISHHWH